MTSEDLLLTIEMRLYGWAFVGGYKLAGIYRLVNRSRYVRTLKILSAYVRIEYDVSKRVSQKR